VNEISELFNGVPEENEDEGDDYNLDSESKSEVDGRQTIKITRIRTRHQPLVHLKRGRVAYPTCCP